MIEREGIPGSVSPEAARIRWYAIADHAGCSRYRADVADGLLIAMLSRDEVSPGKAPLAPVRLAPRRPRAARPLPDVGRAEARLLPAGACRRAVRPDLPAPQHAQGEVRRLRAFARRTWSHL